MVTFAVAGEAMDLGQINVPYILVVLFASLALVLGSKRAALPLALSGLLAAIAVLFASWPLFAAVPLALAAVTVWRAAKSRLPRDAVLGPALPGIALLLWCTVLFAGPDLFSLFSSRGAAGERLATTTTYANPGSWESYTNTYSVPVFLALLLSAAVATLALPSGALVVKLSVGSLVGALTIGLAATIWALGGLPEPLAYFPAKFLHIATWSLAVVLVGLVVRLLAESWLGRVAAGAVSVVILATLMLAPPPVRGPGLAPVPYLVATGEHFGTHDDVVRPFVDLANEDVLRLPWRLNPPHDTTVNLMMSSLAPAGPTYLFESVRAPLRGLRGEFSPRAACEIVQGSRRPVEFHTADLGLAAELEAQCPGAPWTITVIER
jgi:hypothetical protein